MESKDVIKALEYCSEHGMCDDCPYQHKQYDCSDYLKTDAVNLIKNQQAEIEKLKERVWFLCGKSGAMQYEIQKYHNAFKVAKTEAYKEFAKLVKNRMFKGEKTIMKENISTILLKN